MHTTADHFDQWPTKLLANSTFSLEL